MHITAGNCSELELQLFGSQELGLGPRRKEELHEHHKTKPGGSERFIRMLKDLPVHPREVAPEIACSMGSRYLDSINHHRVALQAMVGKDKLEAAEALGSAPSCMDSPSLCSATRLEDAVQTNPVPHTARSDGPRGLSSRGQL